MALKNFLKRIKTGAKRGQRFVPGANLPTPKFVQKMGERSPVARLARGESLKTAFGIDKSALLGGQKPTREQALETALSIGPSGFAGITKKVLPKAAEAFEQGLKSTSEEALYKARQIALRQRAEAAVPGPKTFGQKVKEFFTPISGVDNETKTAYKEWAGKRAEAKTLADEDIVNLQLPKEKAIPKLAPEVKSKVEESIFSNLGALEAAQKGERVFLETGEVRGVSSTFPRWVPEKLKSRELFDSFYEKASTMGTKLTKREQELFDFFKQRIETETGFKDLTLDMLQKGELELPPSLLGKAKPRFKIPDSEGLQAIKDYQAGKMTPYSEDIKQAFDNLYKEAQTRGLDVQYRSRYLPQVYDNTPAEVQEAALNYLQSLRMGDDLILDYLQGKELPSNVALSLKLNPFFSKARLFPDYETAMQFGLRPRYTNPAQLVAHYRQQLEETIANKEFLETLLDKGKLLPEQMAPKHYQPIAGNNVFKGYFASPELKQIIENKFRDEEALGLGETLVKWVAWGSRKAQELALSAGIPYTDINFFSIGQLIKQMTAGDFKSAAAFIRANFTGASVKFFQENQSYLNAMARQGIDLGEHIASYGKVYKNLSTKNWRAWKTWKNSFGREFDKMFNEKTFGSFMPQMHVQTFKDAYQKGLVKGMSIEASEAFAAKVTKAMFGLFEDVGRGQGFKDAMSAAFFAPRFRESILRTLWNTAKSVTTEINNPAFYKNRQLMAGMVLTYGAYNALNKKLSGHYMWDNPPGKQFALMIPTQSGEVVYVEYMPSFLAFARNIVSGAISLVTGDVKTAQQKFGTVFSMPIKITSEILANSDYFGREIYKTYDSMGKKALKIAKYTGLAVGHPYIKETVNQIEDKKPLHQSIIAALELPLKFSSKEKISTQQFYTALDKLEAGRAKAREKIKPIYTEVQKLKAENRNEEALKLYNDLSNEEKEVYQNILKSDKRRETQAGKSHIYELYLRVQQMKKEGRDEEALELVQSLSDEEQKYYMLVKKQFTK